MLAVMLKVPQRAEGKGAARSLYFLKKEGLMKRVCKELQAFLKNCYNSPEEQTRAKIAYERIHNRLKIYCTHYSPEDRQAACKIAFDIVTFRKSLLGFETDIYDIMAEQVERNGKKKVAIQRDKCEKEVAQAKERLDREHCEALKGVKQLQEKNAKSIEQAICRANEKAEYERSQKERKVKDEQHKALRKLDIQKATAIKKYREANEKEMSNKKKQLHREKQTAIKDFERANRDDISDQKRKLNEAKNQELKQLAKEKQKIIKHAKSAAADQIEKERLAAKKKVDAAKRQLHNTTQTAIAQLSRQSHTGGTTQSRGQAVKRKMREAGTGPKKKAKEAQETAKVSNSRCRRPECLWNHLAQKASHSVCKAITRTWCQVEELDIIQFFYRGNGPIPMRRCHVDDAFSFDTGDPSAYDGLVRADLCRQKNDVTVSRTSLRTLGRDPRWEFTLEFRDGAKKAWETTREGASKVDASPDALNVATTWETMLPCVFNFIWHADMSAETANQMRLHLFDQHKQDVQHVKHESDGYLHGLPNSSLESAVRWKLTECLPHLMYHCKNPDDPKSVADPYRLKQLRTHEMCKNERACTGLAKAARQLFG